VRQNDSAASNWRAYTIDAKNQQVFSIRGFGKFAKKMRPARRGQTGEAGG
jgi:nucleoid DNA-binding protein